MSFINMAKLDLEFLETVHFSTRSSGIMDHFGIGFYFSSAHQKEKKSALI